MKPFPSSGGRGDLERPKCSYRKDELLVAFIGVRTPGEHHSGRPLAAASGEEVEQVIRFHLELPVRLNDLWIAMSASRVQVPLARHGGRGRLIPEGCAQVGLVPHLRTADEVPAAAQIPVCSARTGSGSGTCGISAFGGTVPSRPASKSSRAWTISSRVFITKGP